MHLYNTLTRSKQPFSPLNDKTVKLYVCGLTVYSHPHIGNWVAYIYWDILVRSLKASGYSVEHIQNITDVGHLTSDQDAGEDKMQAGALKEGKTAWEVAEKYIQVADHQAYDLLGLLRPTHLPRATEYIEQQKEFVEQLHNKGFTYVLQDGIYFDTSKFPNYGSLAQLDIAGLQFGARVADTGKKNPTDFAVWKFSDTAESRDMEWDSPIVDRKGFPGWHLECSVMARELLGDQIDIHTGGIDHIPVHHTNEIAQTEALTGKPFSQFWVHANHIKVDGTKMSKSLGNIYTLQDIEQKGYDISAFKLLVLSKHYRTEGNFTWDILEAAQNRLQNWRAAADLRWQKTPTQNSKSDFRQTLLSFLQEDLNTPAAVAFIDENLQNLNQSDLEAIHDLLGIDLLTGHTDISSEQKTLLAARNNARNNKDWHQSDSIREQLAAQGIMVHDTKDGQIWSRI